MKRTVFVLALLIAGLAFLPDAAALAVQKGAPAAATPPAPGAATPMRDIHDILAPVAVGFYAPWLMPALLALAAAALLAGAWWLWKKHRKARTIETIVPELPPEMVALKALEGISDIGRLDGKTFYFQLSAILRQYIFERFAVDAPEMTTEEFVPRIDRLPVTPELAQRLRRLCRAMDPIKFGGGMVTEKQMETDLTFAREFVEKTTPADVPEAGTHGQEATGALPQPVS